jgi:hypothetical protein
MVDINSKEFYLIPIGANKNPKNIYPNQIPLEVQKALGKPKTRIGRNNKPYSYYSWIMYYKYFQETGLIEDWLSKYPEWGIVTGKQPNGKVLLIVDQDSHGEELSRVIEHFLGETFTMSTPSGKRHFYYYIDSPTGKEKIDSYLIDNEELKIEFLCSSETKHFQAGFKGPGREVVKNLPIRYIGSMDRDYFLERFKEEFELIPVEKPDNFDYSNYKPLEITEVTTLQENKLSKMAESLIYPVWINEALNGERDNAVRAINGYMIRLGYNKENIEYIIHWINKYAEPDNPNGDSPRNVEIAGKQGKRMFGKPKLLRLGFKELVNFLEVNSLSFQKSTKNTAKYSSIKYTGDNISAKIKIAKDKYVVQVFENGTDYILHIDSLDKLDFELPEDIIKQVENNKHWKLV